MTEFAPVAPIQILEGMKAAGVQGTYHLLLTHHVLEHPQRFHDLFADLPSQCTIIMDNSVVELGDAVSDEKVKQACDVIAPARTNKGALHWIYPVLIDVMADGPKTRETSTESWNWWRAAGQEYSPMVVLQGNDWKSFTQTADYFLLNDQFGRIENVGIPRVLVEHLGTRQLAIQYVDAIRPDINVHLLGFSDDVTDDVICCNLPSVRGIDSAVPVRFSYSVPTGIYTPSADIPPRPADWFEKGKYDPTIAKNLSNIRQWVS